MSVTAVRDQARIDGAGALLRRPPAWLLGLAVLAVWITAWAALRGNDTLALPGLGRTGLHDWFTDRKSDLIDSRDTNVVMQATGALSELLAGIGEWLQELVVQPAFPRPVPQIGWLGVLGLATWAGYALAGWRIALLVAGAFLSFGSLGYWEDSLDLLIVTFFAVALALLIGLPLAVGMATSKTVTAVVTPVLDVLQTVPAFIYLLPLTLFFGLGLPAAVATTVLYAAAPAIRIAAHGIRSVSATTIEATDSLGQTGRQRLLHVQLPMAKKTIIVGINQTVMAALSMATIAAFVDGPGLGKPVLRALQSQAVGPAFVAGLCIVVMAVMLDRTTTAASERAEKVARSGGRDARRHQVALAGTGAVALVLVYVSRTYLWAAEFPDTELGTTLATSVQSGYEWFTSTFDVITSEVTDRVSVFLLNPLQDLLANSPWWLAGAALAAFALVLGGVSGLVTALVCLGGIYLTDLWHDAMVTLSMVLVATLLTMVLAVVLGVWMARRPRVDTLLRPFLDAGQTMPPFVYLIPALLLFGPTRFTAIVASIIYAAPIAIKLVSDGVKAVSVTTVEAATAAGSTPWQIITRVQLPMARGGLVLAANQGLLYVLSMTVIGGLVGAGALGYDSVLGFSQGEFFGKGIAAGAAIVFLGIMLDRVTRRAAERTGAGAH